jgi:PilZ domain
MRSKSAQIPYTEAPQAVAQTQRQFPRQDIRTLVYVTLDDAGAGTLQDVGLGGCAVRSASPLKTRDVVRVRFDLASPRVRVDTEGEVAWSQSSGLAGVRFAEMPAKTEKQLKEWMLTSLLTGASRVATDAEVDQVAPLDGQLMLSGMARPAIPLRTERVGPRLVKVSAGEEVLTLPWWPRPLAAQKFSLWVDGLAIAAAVLLFGLVFLPIAEDELGWLSIAGIMLASIGAFTGVYWLFFNLLGAPSIGEQLVGMATRPEKASRAEREANRFR